MLCLLEGDLKIFFCLSWGLEVNVQALRNILLPLAFIEMNRWKWGQNFAYSHSDISLVTLPLQVAFSEDKRADLDSGLQPISSQCNAKEMVIFWSLYSGLVFIIYFCPTKNSLSCLYQIMTCKYEKRHVLSTDQVELQRLHICALPRWWSMAIDIHQKQLLIMNYQAK